MRKRKNTTKKVEDNTKALISQGGFRDNKTSLPDVVLQMPELFMFNMQSYMNAINSAKYIDYSSRVKLYDMYDSAMLDIHLSGVIDKRLRGVTRFPIEFRRNGKPDEVINKQIDSPWFRRLRKDIISAEFWGFSLMQIYKDEFGDIQYELIDHKHYDPIRRKLLKYQGDSDGIDIDNFENMLFVGTARGLGSFADILPAVLYKRGNMSDWAMFCNIFGMPIREYTYDAGDEDARARLIHDARTQGRNACYIHPEGSNLNLIEAGNKTGSADLYKAFTDYWDSKISIRILGNTLTTDAKETGTQALGTVHKEEEESMNADDRQSILDVLNYEMKDIFTNLGFNVEGGEFVYAKQEKIDPKDQIDIVERLNAMGLPMDDDWLYDTFMVQKPKNYNEIKEQKEAQKQALQEALSKSKDDDKDNLNSDKKTFKNYLNRFFGLAPTKEGADTDF